MRKETDTDTLVEVMFTLSREIESGDGVANAAIYEAATRMSELQSINERLMAENAALKKCRPHLQIIHGGME